MRACLVPRRRIRGLQPDFHGARIGERAADAVQRRVDAGGNDLHLSALHGAAAVRQSVKMDNAPNVHAHMLANALAPSAPAK